MKKTKISLKPINRKKLIKLIDSLRTWVQNDGGDIQLKKINSDNTVVINVYGACVGCSLFDETFDLGIKKTIMQTMPEIVDIKFNTVK